MKSPASIARATKNRLEDSLVGISLGKSDHSRMSKNWPRCGWYFTLVAFDCPSFVTVRETSTISPTFKFSGMNILRST